MSSNDVVKSVSRKLKYYFQVKRLEDGFDLSTADCPRLDHPPLRTRPTLMYDGLHDRPLKHYYSPTEIRAVLTQFKVKKKGGDEAELRRQVERYMRQYSFVRTTLGEPYYVIDKRGNRRIRADLLGHGVSLPKRKLPHKGSYPVLRTVPNAYATRGEAKRLLNNASRLLSATRHIERAQDKNDEKEDKPEKNKRPKSSGAPRSFETRSRSISTSSSASSRSSDRRRSSSRESSGQQQQGGGHNIYTYDPQGNKVYLRTESKNKENYSDAEGSDRDSTYGTNTSSPTPGQNNKSRGGRKESMEGYVTINGDPADDKKVPPWLKKEMKKKEKDSNDTWVRPKSAPHPPPGKNTSKRAKSATPSRQSRGQSRGGHGENKNNSASTSSASSHGSKRKSSPEKKGSRGSPAASGKGSRAKSDVEIEVQSDRSDRSADANVQTGGELLRDFDPMDCVLWDGEKCQYTIEIFTGSRLGAGTRAPVKVALCGDRGRSEDVWLRKPINHHVAFQKGQNDIFRFNTFYVGPLRKIQVGHDSQEIAHSWFVSRIIVKEVERKKKYDIPCEKWFSSQHDAGQTIRVLNVNTTSSYIDEEGDESRIVVVERSRSPVMFVQKGGCAAPFDDDQDESNEEVTYTYSCPPEMERPQSELDDLTIIDKCCAPSDDELDEPIRPDSPKPGSRTNTSTKTIVSEEDSRKDGRRHSSSSSTSYSSSSSTSSSSSSSSSVATSSAPSQQEAKLTVTPPKSPMQRRRDDFFDQEVKQKDYSSVIESLSHVSSDLKQDRQDDFPAPAPEPTRQEEDRNDEDTARLTLNDVDSTPDRSVSRLGSQPEEGRLHMESEEEKADPVAELLRGPDAFSCAESGDLDTLKKWIVHNKEIKVEKNEKGESLLHVAARAGHMEMIQWLSIHLTDLDVETPTGYTAIHMAAIEGHTNIMMVLAAMGARIGTKSTDEQTPLHLAAKNGHMECVKWLVANRASLTALDIDGRTPYDVAVANDSMTVAGFLNACSREQEDPHSSFSRMRFRSNRDDVKIISASERKPSESGTTSKPEKAEDDDEDKESWKNDSRPTSAKKSPRPPSSSSRSSRRSSRSSADGNAHDTELIEKRKVYEEQHQKMNEQHTSFLDTIRQGYYEEEPQKRNADLI